MFCSLLLWLQIFGGVSCFCPFFGVYSLTACILVGVALVGVAYILMGVTLEGVPCILVGVAYIMAAALQSICFPKSTTAFLFVNCLWSSASFMGVYESSGCLFFSGASGQNIFWRSSATCLKSSWNFIASLPILFTHLSEQVHQYSKFKIDW